MSNGRLILMIAIGLFGLISLIASGRAADDVFYWTGLAGFVVAVICLFVVIGRPDQHGEG